MTAQGRVSPTSTRWTTMDQPIPVTEVQRDGLTGRFGKKQLKEKMK